MYKGRLALYEVLVPDDQMKHMTASGASTIDLNKAAVKMGVTTLIADAQNKVDSGLITVEEISIIDLVVRITLIRIRP